MNTGMNTGYEGIHRKYDTSVFEKHELSNGINIWLQKPPILVSENGALVAFFKGVGSQADPLNEPGMAHFLEHIPFRGTEKKPSTSAIVKPLEDVGGEINAQTSIFFTNFVVDTPSDSFDLALETLYEITMRPSIAEKEVDVEVGAIASEYDRKMAEGDNVRWENLFKAIFPNSAWDHFPVGTMATIRNMTAEKLRHFHSQFYHAGNLEIICGGSFSSEEDVIEKIASYFGCIPKGERFNLCTDNWERQPLSRICLNNKQFGQDMLFEVFSLPQLSIREESAIAFLRELLTKGLDSLLVKELRVKRGLVYSSNLCCLEQFPGKYKFELTLPTRRQNFEDGRDIFREVLKKIDLDYIVSKQRARQVERKTLFKTAVGVCPGISWEILFRGRPFSYWEDEELQDSLTVEEVLRWRDYLLDADSTVVEMTT